VSETTKYKWFTSWHRVSNNWTTIKKAKTNGFVQQVPNVDNIDYLLKIICITINQILIIFCCMLTCCITLLYFKCIKLIAVGVEWIKVKGFNCVIIIID